MNNNAVLQTTEQMYKINIILLLQYVHCKLMLNRKHNIGFINNFTMLYTIGLMPSNFVCTTILFCKQWNKLCTGILYCRTELMYGTVLLFCIPEKNVCEKGLFTKLMSKGLFIHSTYSWFQTIFYFGPSPMRVVVRFTHLKFYVLSKYGVVEIG